MQAYGWISLVLCIFLIAISLAIVSLFFVQLAQDPNYSWVDLTMYAVLILFMILVIVLEAQNGTLMLDGRISAGASDVNDSCEQIMQKTHGLTDAMSISVSWRISLILAFIASAFVWAFVMMRIPKWQIFYLTMLLIFIIVYGFLSYYSYHLGGRTSQIVSKNLDIFWRKCQTTERPM